MTRRTLSIPIPIYNFASFIPETLRSILAQDGADEVEIVVVDGASTDNTAEVMAPFVAAHPNLKYVRLPRKGGIDRDMAKSVDYATGDYIWLFSGDDIMAPGALPKVRARIEGGHDLYLCKHGEFRQETGLTDAWPVMLDDREVLYDMAEAPQRQAYFANAKNTEAFFSFMGSLVVKRATWNSVPLDERFVGSCFAHSARLIALMSRGLSIQFVPEVWLDRRPDNDSFMGKGLVERFRIQIEGFLTLGETFFGRDSIEAFHMRRAVRAEFPLYQLLYGRYMCELDPAVESRAVMDRLVRNLYRDFSFSALRTKLAYRTTRMSTFRKWAPGVVAKHERAKDASAQAALGISKAP